MKGKGRGPPLQGEGGSDSSTSGKRVPMPLRKEEGDVCITLPSSGKRGRNVGAFPTRREDIRFFKRRRKGRPQVMRF